MESTAQQPSTENTPAGIRKYKRWLTWGATGILIISCICLQLEIRNMRHKAKKSRRIIETLQEDIRVNIPFLSKKTNNHSLGLGIPMIGKLPMPSELYMVPLANDSGLVTDVKKITIRGVPAPLNASILKYGEGYLLFFRFDELTHLSPYAFFTRIAYVELDSNFNQTAQEYITLNMPSDYAEDPRVIQVGEEIYLTYNDLMEHSPYSRTMHIGRLNLAEKSLTSITNLDLGIKLVEKNWSPFEYIDHNNDSHICFEYNLTPHKILKVHPSLTEDSPVTHLNLPHKSVYQQLLWPAIWGIPRGSTPAQKIGNEYLAFFHSFFQDVNLYHWYVIGAYTFEAEPPFRITSISHHPILFEGIYDSPIIHTASPRKRVLFPSGFVIGKENGREVIHLSCGENDAAVKIITLDKEELYKSLKKQ